MRLQHLHEWAVTWAARQLRTKERGRFCRAVAADETRARGRVTLCAVFGPPRGLLQGSRLLAHARVDLARCHGEVGEGRVAGESGLHGGNLAWVGGANGEGGHCSC